MSSRCDSSRGSLRCQLVTEHRSAHAAWLGNSVMHWSDGVPVEYRDLVGIDWYEGDTSEFDPF